jgi:hypothetical protein
MTNLLFCRKSLLPILAACATVAFSQVVTTSVMDGNVSDPQGAAVVGAAITVTNVDTGQVFKSATDEHGHWVLPSLLEGTYKVSVTSQGFRVTEVENVHVDVGVPKTVNAKLEVGPVSETVEVTGGAELVQTVNATVNSTLEGRQVFELPNITRAGLDLLVSQAGVQTATINRNSSINGLPNGALNVTLDGLNTQDQLLKSSNGFYTYIPIQQDSVEEVTLTTAAAGADATGEGAAQMKFVTKGGTNNYHGGVFWQIRNSALDANYYFNTINHLPTDIIKLNQAGFHLGGPIKKNKLFFFENFEIRRLPNSASFSRQVFTPNAINGNYTYADSTGATHTVNVLALAAGGGFNSTPDPILTKTFNQIWGFTPNGTLVNNISSSNDYIRDTLNYAEAGTDRRNLSTSRVDYNITEKHQLSITYSYNMYQTVPDILNGVVPIFPGTGTILGTSILTGQHSNRFMGTISLRSQIATHMTNEFHSGLMGGTSVFDDGAGSASSYATWKGFIPEFETGGSNLTTAPATVTTITDPQRRTSPVKQFNDSVSWLKGEHVITFGGDFSQINLFNQTQFTESLPQITFGINTGDPVHSGTSDVFTSATMPGATQGQMDDAAGLYAAITGRVYSISRQVVLDEHSHQYGFNPAVDRDQQREFGLFAQDTWKVRPNLTLTLGLRFEQQNPFVNLNNTYSSASLASIWGISGIGHMFQPGVLDGVAPTFTQLTQAYAPPKAWNPTVGFAWQIPGMSGIPGLLFGSHQGATVLRAGYAIATIREGTDNFVAIYGSNPGVTLGDGVDPVNYPQYFGNSGSVLFSQGSLPTRPYPTAPTYPFSPNPTDSINGFDPNLKTAYVQSWNASLQRAVGRHSVVDIRFVGNHGVHEWRQVDLNEVNLFESGFLKDFYNAYNNLLIARNGNINATNSNNFSNQGLPGQVAIPILQTALGTLTNNSSYATYLRQNRAGTLANAIYNNATYMGRLTAAGYPSNLFIVNPTVASGGTYEMTNLGSSYYDALQIEFRRSLASGLQVQGSYVFAKSLVNGASASQDVYSEPTTFRNLNLDKVPVSFDIRNAFKVNWIYELPFGPGRHFLPHTNPILGKVVEGWEISAIDRNQSGTPAQLTAGSSREGMDNNDTGVVLENITRKQLQSEVGIYKTTGSNGFGQVWYLPSAFVTNSLAAYEAGGLNWSKLNYGAPYVGPQLAPGQFGYRVYLYGPWQNHFDFSLIKRTRIVRERANLEFRATCLDCFNLTNFEFASTLNPSSASFGQTTSAYRDLSNSNDPGSRVIEFQLRVSF